MDSQSRCLNCMAEKGDAANCPACGWDEETELESPQHLRPGSMLFGKYLIGRALGQGGFGITYLGWDTNLKIKLAIKEYLPQDLASRAPGSTEVSIYTSRSYRDQFEYGLEKFLQEAQTLAQFIGHPNIVSVRDFFRENGTAYIVMGYVDGITLKEHLARSGNLLPVDKALAIITPVLDALAEVHEVNILHRDISTDNIYINQRGQVILLDFGAARQAIGEKGRSLSIILKPGYTPEEQYRSRGVQGPWTDIYAVAATFYRMITGKMPPESLDRVAEDTLIPPSELGISIEPHLEQALLKALAVRADNRFQSVREFQQALLQESPGAPAKKVPGAANAPEATLKTTIPDQREKARSQPEKTAPAVSSQSSPKRNLTPLVIAGGLVAGAVGLTLLVIVAWLFLRTTPEVPAATPQDTVVADQEPEPAQDLIYSVPGDFGTIQEAIDAVESGAEIVLDQGTYDENIDFKGKDLVLRSSNPGDPAVVENTVIDGGGRGPTVIFQNGESSSSKVLGLHITGGSGQMEAIDTEVDGEITRVGEHVGGGILVMNGAGPTIEKNLIRDNDATDVEAGGGIGGGIIVFGDSSATILSNEITTNIANDGGGIVIFYNSKAVIKDNLISDNRAPGENSDEFTAGGIFIVNQSEALIENNRIKDCYSPFSASGIMVLKSEATIRNNEISAMESVSLACSIVISEQSEAVVENNRLRDNRADETCFAITVGEQSSATIRNNDISAMESAYFAGAIFVFDQSEATIEDNILTGSRADEMSGAISVGEWSKATITGNTITGNSAPVCGGIIAIEEAEITVSGNTFSDNNAGSVGGGIILFDKARARVSENTFENNRAGDFGGAITVDNTSNLELDDPDSNSYSDNAPADIYRE